MSGHYQEQRGQTILKYTEIEITELDSAGDFLIQITLTDGSIKNYVYYEGECRHVFFIGTGTDLPEEEDLN